MNKLLTTVVFALYFGIELTNVHAEPEKQAENKTAEHTNDNPKKAKNDDSNIKKNASSSKANYPCKVLGITIPYQYEGECDDDLSNTEKGETAKLRYSTGEYIGEFNQGYMEGQGKLTFSNGDIYEGRFLNGKMNGTGTYYWENSDYYYGEFADGKKQGHGIFFDNVANSVEQVTYDNNQKITPKQQTATHNYDINLDEMKGIGIVSDNPPSTVGKFRTRLRKGVKTNQGIIIAVDKTTGRVLVSKNRRVSTQNGVVISVPSEDWVNIRNIYPPQIQN